MNQTLRTISVSLDPDERLRIALGKQNSLILTGRRDMGEGPLVLIDHIFTWVVIVNIIKVELVTLADLDDKFCQEIGYPDTKALRLKLRRGYPGVDVASEVTIITWEKILGSVSGEFKGEIKAEIPDIKAFVRGVFGKK